MAPDPGEAARLAEIAESKARRAALTAEHGKPEHVAGSDALALARTAGIPVDPRVTAGDVFAAVYRDEAAADAWAESNLTHYGHPQLAKVPLPDGRVVGILDLRPALEKFAAGEEP
jgi:hypothetical protein